MPSIASRLTVELTGTKLERLQEISEEDALAEGVRPECEYADGPAGPQAVGFGSAIPVFAEMWNSLHGPSAWDRNPEVVAIAFKVHRRNVANVGGEAA